MTISIGDLESKIYVLNEMTDNPTSYGHQGLDDVKVKANVGHYYLHEAHSLYYLCQIRNKEGLAKNSHHNIDVFYGKTKKELYQKIHIMMVGVRIGKNCADRFQGARS